MSSRDRCSPGARAAQVVRDDHRRRRRQLVGRRGHGHRAARPERRRKDHDGRVPRGAAAAGCRVGAGARRRPVARGARPPGPGRGDAPGGRAADHQPAAAAAAPPRRPVRRARAARRARRPARDRASSRARRCGGCPAGSASGWRWPPPCSPAPTCCSSTSRPPGSTRTRGSRSGTSCGPRRTAGACVVVTTHSFEEAERLADRVVIMAAGRVVADGTLDEVRGGRSLEDVYFALTDRGGPVSTARPPGRGAARQRVLARAGFETRTLLANGEQLLVSLVLPALALVGLTVASVPDLGPGATRRPRHRRGPGPGRGVDGLHRPGHLDRVRPAGRRAAPARHHPPGPRRAARGQGRGRALGARRCRSSCSARWAWRSARDPEPAASCRRSPSLLLGSAAFVALALLLAGTLRAEAVLAVANLVWVLLLGLGRAGAHRPAARGARDRRGAAALRGARRRGAHCRSSTAAGRGRSGRSSSGGACSGRCSPGGSSAGATDRPVTSTAPAPP